MTDFIQFEKIQGQYGQFGQITLNRPAALNALNAEMILALDDLLEQSEKDPQILAVIVQSSSEKAFCAGGDIRSLYDAGSAKNADVNEKKSEALTFFEQEYALNHRIYHYSKPYICFLNGITMGGGVGISLHGSHAVAGENFRFAMPETAIGLFPDIGASHLLHQCPGVFGLYLGLTGARIGREDAHALNLLDYCIDVRAQQALIPELYALDLRKQAKTKVSALLRKYHVEPAYAVEKIPHAATRDLIVPPIDTIFHRLPWVHEIFSEKSVEKIIAHIEHNASKNSEIEKTWNDLKTKSPLSLKITFEQFQRTQFLSLDDCLKIDYILVSHFLKSHDLYEGIRAVIIDKDNQPRWSPETLEDVSETMINLYFD